MRVDRLIPETSPPMITTPNLPAVATTLEEVSPEITAALTSPAPPAAGSSSVAHVQGPQRRTDQDQLDPGLTPG